MQEQVLIVEDEQDVAELLRYNLEKENYRPIVAHSGEEAIAAVRRQMPDAVLLDIMLPELDGWEVCRMLRENTVGKSVPIIMLTALCSEEARVRGLTIGADDYVSKPFFMRELLLKIRKLIDRQRTVNLLSAKSKDQDTSLKYLVHELKNSMNVIGGVSSLALRKEETKNYLRTIKVAAIHADSLLSNASLLSKLENREGSLSIEQIDVGPILWEAVDVLRDTAQKRQIEIVIMNTISSPVTGNSTAARQVLMNLLSNAIAYNRHGGKVWITAEEMHDRVDISITDEGCGIQQDEIPRIFDKFYRVIGSEQNKGSGLGLYIVKILIQAMSGTINAKSKPGVGSTFTVSFQRTKTSINEQDKEVVILHPLENEKNATS